MITQQSLASRFGTADVATKEAPVTSRSTNRGLRSRAAASPCPRVLVVEDDAWLAIDLEQLLSELGYDICTIVNSGAAAFMAAGVHRPDLVLIDLCGSGPYSAKSVAGRIRRDFGIPSLCLEGVLKPCDSTRFRNELNRALGELHPK